MDDLIVWVRLGPGENEHMRHLTFKIPDRIPQKQLLQQGFAIDGSQAIIAVSLRPDSQGGLQFGSNIDGGYTTLAEALNGSQIKLAEFLSRYDYEVTFK